jgi:hypothetical protein
MDYIQHITEHPEETQEKVFDHLINKARHTAWGLTHQYQSVNTIRDLQHRVPVQQYDVLKPWIERMMAGEQNILWPSDIRWFAKSSGTTSDKSKFIPVSFESLEDCHINAAKDILSIYCDQNPETNLFSGKGLVMGGSHQINSFNESTSYGDLSAVIMQNLPFWVHFIRTPQLDVALMSDWEEKLEKMARETMLEDVTNLSGVPTWTIILIKRILEISGKRYIDEVWPNLELYIHGGVSFTPYREQFSKLTSRPIHYLETYNASEGFFGIQYQQNAPDLLLMTDYGIFYEFMPMTEFGKENPKTLILGEVAVGILYAPVITTNSGLCRYLVGDVIKFTRTKPYTFVITGRTKHFINAFGEELMVDDTEKALSSACLTFDAEVRDYTAAPIYFSDTEKPTHQWLIEFSKHPSDFEGFCVMLDLELQKNNSDYEAKRYKNMAMQPPKIQSVPEGTFNRWLKNEGKLGGQHKVPRLSNDRSIVEAILTFI